MRLRPRHRLAFGFSAAFKPELFLPPGEQFKKAMAEVDPAVRVDLLAPGESTEVGAR